MTELRSYADRRPIAVPGSWAELRGPGAGPVQVPKELNWTGRRDYDLDDPADVRVLYERVLIDAVAVEVIDRVVNADRLRELWPQLFLPRGVRAAWEARFPDLTSAS
jgi:hypothetical protein